ncbi:carbohydrate ABC transporter permease [Acinetobacter puyangensis]|uniref:carbohydrate ABC transporter permease n=1 Tax=Acinetobacter puyangensis TaxID=1096779 RepID=UPI003A4DB9CB
MNINHLGQTFFAKTLAARRLRTALYLLLPALLLLLLVAALPLGQTILFSFSNATADDPQAAQWVAFDNYFSVFQGEYLGILTDTRWWLSVKNTIIFAFFSVSLELFFGMAIALSLNREFPYRGIVRALVLIPWAIPTIVSAQMWVWMLHDQYGIINWILTQLGLIDTGVAWLSQPSTALATIIVIDVWKSTPFMALMLLAALQTVPNELKEAARIDGATSWQTFRHIVLPIIFPAVAVAVVFRMLDALRVFDLIYIANPSDENVISMSVYARRLLFEYGKFGEGSAASVLLFLVVCGLAIVWIKFSGVIERQEH